MDGDGSMGGVNWIDNKKAEITACFSWDYIPAFLEPYNDELIAFQEND